jgi:hypothetical protein
MHESEKTVMQKIDREAEWLVAVATAENDFDDAGAIVEHWLLEDFADIVPPTPDHERQAA